MNQKGFSTRDLCMIGLWTAVMRRLAQIAIPMPLGVPMTMQTFAVTAIGIAISACILPFIPTAIIKAVLATILDVKIRMRLVKLV